MSSARPLTLPQGLPGFPELTRAELRPIDDPDMPGVYAELVDAVSPLTFLLARPEPFFPDYVVVADDAVGTALTGDAAHRQVWLVLVHDGAQFLANLRAPLLVQPDTGVAVQAVLDDSQPLRAALI